MTALLTTWTFEPSILVALASIVTAYIVGLRRFRPQTLWDEHHVATREIIFFASGMFLLFLALCSPIDTLSDSMFSIHMIQHMLIVYLAPPLLLVGMPAWFWTPILRVPFVKPFLRFVMSAIPATIIFNGILVVWHFPMLWQFALVSTPIHALEHVCFLAAGIIAWWPVFSPTPEVPRLSYPAQLLYLFVQSLVPAVIGSFITFSSIVIYPLYSETPKLWGLTPLVDQQIAGLSMKLLGTIFLWVLLTVRFFQWFNHEEHEKEKLVDDQYPT